MKKNKRSNKNLSAAVSSSGKSPEKTTQLKPEKQSRLRRDNSICFVYASRLFFFAFAFWFWAVRYGNFLYMSQNYDIFLWDSWFFQQNASRLGGLLTWFSSFVIQFFYYPFAGGLILASFLTMTAILIASFFRLKRYSFLLSFLPPLTFMLTIPQINYYFFEAFDLAFLYSIIFSLFYTFLIGSIFLRINQQRNRLLFSILTTFALYPVFGFFALFSAFLCLLKEWTYTFDSKRSIRCEIIVLSILITPICWFPFFSASNGFFWFFISGLLEESVFDKDITTKILFYGPYWGLILLILLGAVCGSIYVKLFSRRIDFDLNKPNDEKTLQTIEVPKLIPNSQFRWNVWGLQECFLSIILFLFCSVTVSAAFFPQNYKILLQMGKLLEEKRWNEIIDLEAKIPIPINPNISLRTLALIKTDQFPERFFERPFYPKFSNQLMSVSSFKMLGDRILVEHGYFNLATRTAMNNLNDKNERSLWAIKTLALSAIGQKESVLAEKYLKRIEKTLFHRSWAQRYREYLRHKNEPVEKQSAVVRSVSEEFQPLWEFGIQENYTSNVLALDYVILLGFQEQNFENRSRRQQANQLMAHLILMDMDVFFEKLNSWLKTKGNDPIPEYFQQAVLFDSYFLKKKRIDPELCPISPKVQERFNQFVAISNDIKKNPRYEKEGIKKLDRDFKDTFWYHEIFTEELLNY
ncbi:MAG: DUF6057 family protein [Planctomycetia bacterium]|nr:DUF6057 family protein [Planctomycetia bacterium]